VRVGLITGSGFYDWPDLADAEQRKVDTEYGAVDVTGGTVKGVEVVQLSRHGPGHHRLSNQVAHRANLAALLDCGVDALVSLTVCGGLDPAIELGSLVVFDDLYFPGNRLPDGSLCTWHTDAGAADRGHWIFDVPFSELLRRGLIDAARQAGTPAVPGGCYAHVDGPRFNSRTEIAALAALGVTAVSQTAGPEVVLAGEAKLPMALLGYVTDHANGVTDSPEPVEALLARMAESRQLFAAVVTAALPMLSTAGPAGVVHRFAP
jgi:5'-methylthioadenosine phosphorylase